MSHQVIWTKFIVERFIEYGGLTKEEEMIMRTRAAGWTRTEQAMRFGMSLATVDRTIRRLKVKYDHAQKYDPALPPRRRSAKELYLDTDF